MVRRRIALGLGLILLSCAAMSACSRGVRQPIHTVRAGETLSAIGVRYGVPFRDIARLNNLADPDRIRVGQRLRIPHGGTDSLKTARSRPALARRRSATRRAAVREPQRGRNRPPAAVGRFIWPTQGVLTSHYGPRNNSFHDGIDIAAPAGTPIVATAPGEVIYSGVLRGYGKVIILRHANGYASVYAHNSRHYVKQGQSVKQGQKIAAVGKTGRATGPNLHFEIRRNNKARNPLKLLPPNHQIVSR